MASNSLVPALELETASLLAELRLARQESDRLFRILTPEALYERPIAERHRVLFYIGHLDGFDAIQICRAELGLESPDSDFDRLFQAGIDPDGGNLPTDTPADWPSLDKIYSYVERCRNRVDEVLDLTSQEMLLSVLEHRQMHIETLAYMFHNFAHQLKSAPAEHLQAPKIPPTVGPKWREIPAGEAVLGRKRDAGFGWDNEFDQVRRFVPAFRVQRYPVTNGEYLEFVSEGAPLPNFWRRQGGQTLYRGMFEDIPLPLDWPVYVTQREAEAFAKWQGKSVMSEEQFHRAAYGDSSGQPFEHGNFDFKRWDPESVYASPAGDSKSGVSQLVGNGWEWTSTPFAPFPGFAPRPSYPGYSANFFDNEHYVMKGGSARTAARLLRPSFRNWFRRDYPYMYAKFRCVEN